MNQKHMDEISWLEVSGLIPQAVPSERMLGMSVLVPESQVERSGEEPSPTLTALLHHRPLQQGLHVDRGRPARGFPVPDHFPFPMCSFSSNNKGCMCACAHTRAKHTHKLMCTHVSTPPTNVRN